MESLDSYYGRCRELALQYLPRMRPFIEKIIRKVINFNDVLEEDDYWNEAYIAIYTAVLKYNRFRQFGQVDPDEDFEVARMLRLSDMKFETFAYWYVERALYRAADMGDVEFLIPQNGNGTEKVLTASEYYKNRKLYPNARSFRKVVTFTELEEQMERDFDPIPYEEYEKIKNGGWNLDEDDGR